MVHTIRMVDKSERLELPPARLDNIGQGKLLALTHQQLLSKTLFQLTHMLTHTGLRHVQPLGNILEIYSHSYEPIYSEGAY